MTLGPSTIRLREQAMVALPRKQPEEPRAAANGAGSTCAPAAATTCPTIAVRYGAMNWLGEFTHPPETAARCGGKVVVQTERGIELGEQTGLSCVGCGRTEQIRRYVENSGPEFLRLACGSILREATPQDIDEHARLNENVKEDIDRCALLAARLGLDLKVVTAEHLLGGERIVFYFRAGGRIDFRQLVRELAQHYQTRIEMRQVGARDEARLVADYEICGRECCCKNFLKKLQPVNMKMAKLQKSTLDPSKVSGRCGRLRCCLRYEHEGYEALAARLPRIHSRVDTADGPATVLDRQILTQLVALRLERDQREVVVPVEEILAFDLPKRKPPVVERPAPAPSRPPAGQRPKSRFVPDAAPPANAAPPERSPPAPRPAAAGDVGRTPPRGEPPPPAERRARTQEAQPPSEPAPGARRRRRRRRRPRRNRPEEPRDPDKT